MRIPVTVFIPVKNEEKNLPILLPLLSEFDEVIVIDSQSTDKTPDIVKSFNYRLVEFVWNGHFPKKRNWALRNVPTRNEWVFFLDADEFPTPEFISEIRDKVNSNENNVGYWIYYKNEFMGKFLKHDDKQTKLALFKKSAGEYEHIEEDDDEKGWSYAGLEIHEHPILNGPTGKIKGVILHREFKGLTHYIQKHNEYSNWEANRFLKLTDDVRKHLTFYQRVKYTLLDTWYLGHLYFIYLYIVKGGFLDGREGHVYASLKRQYFINIKCKIEEIRASKNV